MNEIEEWPCVRGCTWAPAEEGEAPRPKPAKHGLLCNSCYYRLQRGLEMIPDLMANMRAQITPSAAAMLSDRVQGGGDGAPAPLRIDPLDASDGLFAKLVSWTEVFGGELSTPQPSVAVWINFREVQGSKPVTPQTAHQIATQLTSWFLVRLEDITAIQAGVAFHDDLCYGWEESRGVFNLATAYGIERPPLRPSEKRECPVCGQHEVFVAWPDSFNPDLRVMCGRCKWVAEEDKYGHYAELFKSA